MAPTPIENPTIIERFVSLIPLPYPLAAIIWSFVLPGSPGFYLETATPLSPTNLTSSFLTLLLFLYLFLMVRYMRLRVVAAEALIAPKLSGGEQDYQQAFRRLTQTAPIIILTLVFGTPLLSAYASLGFLSTVLTLTANIITVYLASFAFLSYLWVFATASLGLHKLGGPSLKLGSFLEDRMMGAKPMGNLSLSLTITYFGGLLIVFLTLTSILPSSISSTAAYVAFLLIGVALFFLPLNSIHAKMQAEKRRLLREIGARYPRLNWDSSPPRQDATLDDVRTGLARLTDLQELEMLDKKIASLPTWPFDIQVVSKFVTIVLSVTAVLLSRLITGLLHI